MRQRRRRRRSLSGIDVVILCRIHGDDISALQCRSFLVYLRCICGFVTTYVELVSASFLDEESALTLGVVDECQRSQRREHTQETNGPDESPAVDITEEDCMK